MVDSAGILNTYLANLGSQIDQLKQPAPQQGGILSGADPVMLSLAAGLLSPTTTGGFGESVAKGLTSAQGPLSEIRKQEAARADKLATLEQARAKLALDYMELQQGGRRARGDDPSLIIKRYEDMSLAYAEQANAPGLQKNNPVEYENLMKRAEAYRQKADQIREALNQEEQPEDYESTKTSKPKQEQPKSETSAPKKDDTGKTTAKPYTGDKPPASYPNAKKGKHGYWYVPIDPNNPSKGYQYVAE